MGAAVTDSAFRFFMANPAFLTMVGYSSEELQQLSILDICVDGDRDEYRVALRELREGVRLQYDPSSVRADQIQLQQVLLNLLTNAVDSMASITDRPHVLRVRSERLEDWALISVQDSGTGINPEHAERVFEAFFTTKPNGTGLGLSICRSIVEAHEGRLSASAVHPYGSVFQVMLPVAH